MPDTTLRFGQRDDDNADQPSGGPRVGGPEQKKGTSLQDSERVRSSEALYE